MEVEYGNENSTEMAYENSMFSSIKCVLALICRTTPLLMKQAVAFCVILVVKQVGHEIAVGDHQ